MDSKDIGTANAAEAVDQAGQYTDPFRAFAINVLDTAREQGADPVEALAAYCDHYRRLTVGG